METAQEVLDFITEYADFYLIETQNETDPKKAKDKFMKHLGMRQLINAVREEM